MDLPWLEITTPFPPPSQARKDPNGLLAAGGDLSPERLLLAYRSGIFPWFDAGQPILWWSPDPRAVLFPERLHVSRSLAKTRRRATLRCTKDQAFSEVIQACAAPRKGEPGTWITPAMQAAYQNLHRRGIAHSVETWNGDELVGGVYGLAIGRIFFGESMFSRQSDASKLALVYLCEFLREQGYVLMDCQVANRHTLSLGVENIPRADYLTIIERSLCPALPPHWPVR